MGEFKTPAEAFFKLPLVRRRRLREVVRQAERAGLWMDLEERRIEEEEEKRDVKQMNRSVDEPLLLLLLLLILEDRWGLSVSAIFFSFLQ
jgi:hypothetical protein